MTNGPSDYWITYFPWFVVFALGMSITVVPLTTTVMKAVHETQSGIASGINNSVTRISGIFINAILGAVAIFVFTDGVAEFIYPMNFSPEVTAEVMLEAKKLGEATPSSDYSNLIQEQQKEVYNKAFIKTYQTAGIISAGLAFIAAGIGFFMIKDN